VRVTPRDRGERKCAAWAAHHYEVHAYYTTSDQDSLELLEEALGAVPGVYLTTQVHGHRPAAGRNGSIFTNPAWPAPLGTARRDRNSLRTQVLGLICDQAANPPANARPVTPDPSPQIFCRNCSASIPPTLHRCPRCQWPRAAEPPPGWEPIRSHGRLVYWHRPFGDQQWIAVKHTEDGWTWDHYDGLTRLIGGGRGGTPHPIIAYGIRHSSPAARRAADIHIGRWLTQHACK
jgi:hypothetical protein